ncbi:unnamed protein product, partial [Merluccius merluccius]
MGNVSRKRVTRKGRTKDKNRDAARKSRKKQTEKADELHKEHQRLEQSNTVLGKEIAALRAEFQHYTSLLERHEPVCLLLAPSRSLAPTSTSTSASPSLSPSPSPSITAATLHDSSPRPSETPRSPPDTNTYNFAFHDRPLRVSDVAPTVLTSCSHRGRAGSLQPPHPTLGAPSHQCSTSGPGGLATTVTHPFALPAPCSSSSSCFITHFDNPPLPPASFTPPHPAPASDLPIRSDRVSLETSISTKAPVTVLPHHSQGAPSANDSYLGQLFHGSFGSSSVHAYQNATSSSPGPYRAFVPLDPPLATTLAHVDGHLPAASLGTPGSTSFSELRTTTTTANAAAAITTTTTTTATTTTTTITMETTKLPPSSPSSPTTGFSVPSAEKVDGFPRRSMRRARQRRSHSSSQFRYQSSQVELTPLPLLKGAVLPLGCTGRRPDPRGPASSAVPSR